MGARIRFCLRPAHLRQTLAIALVMGTAYTAINQLQVLLSRGVDATTALRCVANYVLPFVVANLGLLSSYREASGDPISVPRREEPTTHV